jgi:hypothetical protein
LPQDAGAKDHRARERRALALADLAPEGDGGVLEQYVVEVPEGDPVASRSDGHAARGSTAAKLRCNRAPRTDRVRIG